MYGDRDFACNWIGGEAVSLAIPYANQEQFNAAGYAGIRTNDSYVGGQVRQHGNLSFSRVYQAGHEVPSYQPETAYRIFMRALTNRDIATGEVNTVTDDPRTYQTFGPASTWQFKNEDPPEFQQFCYVLNPTALCTEEQIAAVQDGDAEIINYIVVDSNSTELFPAVAEGASASGTSASSGNGGAEETGSSETGSSETGSSETGSEESGPTSTGATGANTGGAGSLRFEVLGGTYSWGVLALTMGAAVFLI